MLKVILPSVIMLNVVMLKCRAASEAKGAATFHQMSIDQVTMGQKSLGVSSASVLPCFLKGVVAPSLNALSGSSKANVRESGPSFQL
jgi:hypothetical protein